MSTTGHILSTVMDLFLREQGMTHNQRQVIRDLLDIPFSQYTATVPPGPTNDESEGYSLGSKWYDSVAKEAWVCVDPTLGAAAWVESTLDASEVAALIAAITPEDIGAAPAAHAGNHTDGTDNIQDATASQKGLATAAQISKLDGIETAADVTDAENVEASGAVMVSATSTAGFGFVIDEDDMSSDSDTKVPSQQSVKAYVATVVSSAKAYQGGYNAATDTPSLDSGTPVAGIVAGDVYDVTVAGNFFTAAVEVGDTLVANRDNPTTSAHWVILQTNLDVATETVKGIVELATAAEVNSGWSGAADKVVRSSLLGIKIEGGSVILKGTADPTAAGANTGTDCQISGQYNHTNSGTHCQISGYYNNGNSGHYCQISGSNNHSNTGTSCQISGQYNHTNSGASCSISGYNNYSNTGHYCQISGSNNYSNTGHYCQISGSNNYSNTGTHCQISGQYNHTNSGASCSISGQYNHTNSGASCSISGSNNYSNSGHYCQISGYNNYSNTGPHCSISGRNASNNALGYARVHGGGQYARIIDLVAKTETTNATPTTLTLGGAAEGTTNRINIPAYTAWCFTATIVARSGDNCKTFTRRGLIGNNGGAVTISALDTLGTDSVLGALAVSIAITADNTNDALKIAATGIAATTIQWAAQVNITQVG